MKKQITAIITAALILANLTACGASTGQADDLSDRSGEISEQVSNNSEESSNSENNSESSDSTTVESEAPVEAPTFLKGPAGDPIYPSDITYVCIVDKTAPDNERRADISELTEDNLSFVQCDNFGYLREPEGIRYNRYESTDKFESEFPHLYIGEELANKNPIKRVYVGDEVCGMTVSEIETTFVKARCDTSVPFWNDSIQVKFKGEKTLTGYLSVESLEPDYPGTEGNVTFWLDEQSSPLPITYLNAGENGAESSYCSGVGFYNDTGDIYLGSIYDGGMMPSDCDESLLDGITYGDKDIHVKITIDDYTAFGYGDNRAVLKSLERL